MKENCTTTFLGREVSTVIEYANYDPDKSNNGGSYYQPLIVCESGSDVFIIEDTSCGDFGTRISVRLSCKDAPADSVDATYGTMVSDPYTEFLAN